MSGEGRAEIRRVVEQLLADFLRSIAARSQGKPVDAAELRRALEAFCASPQLSQFLSQAHHRLLDAAERELLLRQRGDPFQRLLAHPLSDLFTEERLSRDILFNYFSFLHLVLGDTREALTERCAKIVADLRGADPLAFSWDDFYDDPRAKLILWAVLARIAESFRRFDARREWFIGLMEHRPQAISLASNAFLPRLAGEEQPSFGTIEFNLMFGALFGPLRRLSAQDALDFERHFGYPPDKVFGPLLKELEAFGAFS